MAGNLYSRHTQEYKVYLLEQKMPSNWKEVQLLGRVRIQNEPDNL